MARILSMVVWAGTLKATIESCRLLVYCNSRPGI